MDEREWLASTDAERMVEWLGNSTAHDEALLRFGMACIQHCPPKATPTPEPGHGPGNGFLLARWATRHALPLEGPGRDATRAWQARLLRELIPSPKPC
jgi:hypothetical protein